MILFYLFLFEIGKRWNLKIYIFEILLWDIEYIIFLKDLLFLYINTFLCIIKFDFVNLLNGNVKLVINLVLLKCLLEFDYSSMYVVNVIFYYLKF